MDGEQIAYKVIVVGQVLQGFLRIRGAGRKNSTLIPTGERKADEAFSAQALQAETNEQARYAAIQVLGTRAQRTPGTSGSYPAIKTPPGGFTGCGFPS